MTRMLEFVEEFSDEIAHGDAEGGLLLMDGFDDCIIGVGQRFSDFAVVYDFERVIRKLMTDGMSRDEALEFFEFNQLGAWVGERTPIFMHFPSAESVD